LAADLQCRVIRDSTVTSQTRRFLYTAEIMPNFAFRHNSLRSHSSYYLIIACSVGLKMHGVMCNCDSTSFACLKLIDSYIFYVAGIIFAFSALG